MSNAISREDLARADRVIPGACFGYTQLPSDVGFVASHGAGSHLWATDGREFIDYTLGSGPLIVGHAHPEVVSALKAQFNRGTHFYAMNLEAVSLAETIVECVPSAHAVKLCSDGTQATFFAERIARAWTGRDAIIKFDGAYHGHHDYALPGFPGGMKEFGLTATTYKGIPKGATDTVYVAPFNNITATRALAEKYGSSIAAIIVEPVQRAIEPRPGFLAALRSLCDEIGCLLIFDEVVTGFRLDRAGAQGAYGVFPDLTALGKAIGGGLPLGAVAASRELIELTVPQGQAGDQAVFMSGTLNGNPLSAAAGRATLAVMDECDGPKRLKEYGSALASGLRELGCKLSIPIQVIGPNAFIEVVFGEDPVVDSSSYVATDREAAVLFGVEMLRRGIYLVPGTKMYISTTHTDVDLAQTLESAEESLNAIARRVSGAR